MEVKVTHENYARLVKQLRKKLNLPDLKIELHPDIKSLEKADRRRNTSWVRERFSQMWLAHATEDEVTPGSSLIIDKERKKYLMHWFHHLLQRHQVWTPAKIYWVFKQEVRPGNQAAAWGTADDESFDEQKNKVQVGGQPQSAQGQGAQIITSRNYIKVFAYSTPQNQQASAATNSQQGQGPALTECFNQVQLSQPGSTPSSLLSSPAQSRTAEAQKESKTRQGQNTPLSLANLAIQDNSLPHKSHPHPGTKHSSAGENPRLSSKRPLPPPDSVGDLKHQDRTSSVQAAQRRESRSRSGSRERFDVEGTESSSPQRKKPRQQSSSPPPRRMVPPHLL